MLAYEAFIRRAAEIDMPFMLKGSYVTRQYFDNPMNRIPADMDWLYTASLAGVEEAEKAFSKWATAVTEYPMHDGVVFKSFSENAFWRMIDYAMADDFPTVNTDLSCSVEGNGFETLQLDISFNLPVEAPPVPLLYKPLKGQPFTIPYTAPISLQVAWKLHQTLVRLRWKDILDLIYLLQHPLYNQEAIQQTLDALVKECRKDNINLSRIKLLVTDDLKNFFQSRSLIDSWNWWRHQQHAVHYPYSSFDRAEFITDVTLLPINLSVFTQQFADALYKSGFTEHCRKSLQNYFKYEEKIKRSKQNVETKTVNQPTKNQLPQKSNSRGILQLFRKLFK